MLPGVLQKALPAAVKRFSLLLVKRWRVRTGLEQQLVRSMGCAVRTHRHYLGLLI